MMGMLLPACGQEAPPATTAPAATATTAMAATATAPPAATDTLPPATSTTVPEPTATISPELASKIFDAQGSTTVHDPSMAKDGETYYAFMTGQGIPIHCSKDLRVWEDCGNVFQVLPDWLTAAVPGVKDPWAPDINFHDGKYYLYYAGSTFGSNHSAIGLATNATLDESSPNYKWVDQGLVIASDTPDNYNAIDPNLSYDQAGQPWLSFGSFWSGIKLVKLDPSTYKPAKGAELVSLADYPLSSADAIEAPFITHRGDFYYLFVSRDFCCKGVDSTYNIRVGRAKEISGPYVDQDGKPMLGGGGTLVYDGSARWHGPGGQSIFVEGDTYYLVYHSYDADYNGTPTLRIEKLSWDQANWPVAPSALAGE
jgi:arabinan endo-1,5-alpha-L-arabinosidase